MGVARIQMGLGRIGGLPEDEVVNTWYVSDGLGSSVSAGDAESLADAFLAFYEDANSWWSEALSGAVTRKVYDMADSTPRVPVFEDTNSITAPTNNSLPAEVSLCLSFGGDPISGVSMARRRGRVFLPPMQIAVLSTAESGGDIRPASSVFTAFNGFYDSLKAAIELVGSYTHVVYSPTQDASQTLLQSIAIVTQAWMDNAFDIQRRRGAKPTARTYFLGP